MFEVLKTTVPICKLLKQLDICAISEHWLYQFENAQFHQLHKDFSAHSTSPRTKEDTLRCTPRYIRGHGGVAIVWRKSLNPYIRKLTTIASERVVGIQLVTTNRPVCFLSVYLPTRTGCTDEFKECLDYIASVLAQLAFDNDVVIMGDFNADPGPEGGPASWTQLNEQGRILLRYLQEWNYTSLHLHKSSPPSHTYLSDAHASLSTIDHILSPLYLMPRVDRCFVLDEDPLRTLFRALISLIEQSCQRKPLVKSIRREQKHAWGVFLSLMWPPFPGTLDSLISISLALVKFFLKYLQRFPPRNLYLTWNLAGQSNYQVLTQPLKGPIKDGELLVGHVTLTTLSERTTKMPKVILEHYLDSIKEISGTHFWRSRHNL